MNMHACIIYNHGVWYYPSRYIGLSRFKFESLQNNSFFEIVNSPINTEWFSTGLIKDPSFESAASSFHHLRTHGELNYPPLPSQSESEDPPTHLATVSQMTRPPLHSHISDPNSLQTLPQFCYRHRIQSAQIKVESGIFHPVFSRFLDNLNDLPQFIRVRKCPQTLLQIDKRFHFLFAHSFPSIVVSKLGFFLTMSSENLLTKLHATGREDICFPVEVVWFEVFVRARDRREGSLHRCRSYNRWRPSHDIVHLVQVR